MKFETTRFSYPKGNDNNLDLLSDDCDEVVYHEISPENIFAIFATFEFKIHGDNLTHLKSIIEEEDEFK